MPKVKLLAREFAINLKMKLTQCERMQLVWDVIEEPIPKPGPSKGVTNDAGQGAAKQGPVFATITWKLVVQAHEQVNVLDCRICLPELADALMKKWKAKI